MKKVDTRKIFAAWWPLAASWLFMGTELPLVSAVMARLALPKISLAAYGGVVFPIALIIEAPVIMLLAASTALSKDEASYRKLYRFMMWTGFATTMLHAAIAFTPLFDVLVARVMQVPPEIIEPSRLGMRIMLPWTWTIAYRRYHQGVLIRFGHSKAISIGTALRLTANAVALFIGSQIEGIPGIVVGTSGIAAGVITEAVYTGFRVQPVLRNKLMKARPIEPALTWPEFYKFYIPLALTSFINLIVQPMGSAALSRMPMPLESLAVWPVLSGFLFMWRSLGFAYNEVVVSQLDEPGSVAPLKRFSIYLSVGATIGLTLIASTPLARFWFQDVSGLEPALVDLALAGLWVSLLWPALSILQNTYQGVIVNGKRTVGVTISVIILVGVTSLLLTIGSSSGRFTGLFVGLVAFQAGYLAQGLHLYWASKPVLKNRSARDHLAAEASPLPDLAGN